MMKCIKVLLLLLLLLSGYRGEASRLQPGGVAVKSNAAPVVTSVWVPGGGSYHIGSQLTFTVSYNVPISIDPGPMPLLDVIIGNTTKKVPVNNFVPAGFIVFTYVVQEGDLDTDGIALGAQLDMNGAVVKGPGGEPVDPQLNNVSPTDLVNVNGIRPSVVISAPTNIVNQPFTATITFSEIVNNYPSLTLSGCNVSNMQTVDHKVFTIQVDPVWASGSMQVSENSVTNTAGNNNTASNVFSFSYDNTSPQITSVTVPADKRYKIGDILSFTVNYSENILLNNTGGNPYLNLVLASGTRVLTLAGSGPNYISFSYQVQAGDEDLSGPTLGPEVILNGATIRDAAGNDATNSLQNAGSLMQVLVDGNPPVVPSVSVPADGYYKAGNVLEFGVNISEPVTLNLTNGTPSIDIVIGGAIRTAVLNRPGAGNSFIFSYTVQPGEIDMDGINVGNYLALNGSTIRDLAGNNLVQTLNNIGITNRVFVNAIEPAVTLSTTATSPLNQPFTAKITFSEVVTGFAVTDIIASNATLSGLSGSDNITFTVLVTPTAAGAVNLTVPANVAVNIGNNGNAASNTLTLTYDPIPLNIANVTVPANKTYKTGEVLSFNVYYNKDIVADITHGVPFIYLVLASGTRNVPVTAIGTNYLTFSYTVQDGDEDLTGPALGAGMVLNNGTIRDAAGNDAAFTLQNVASLRNVLVDAKAPVVNSVTVPANNYYHSGDPLSFTVNFSENAIVSTTAGTPAIDVTIGSTVQQAYYVSGTGTTNLIFSYQVQNGDIDMDGIAVGAMHLNNGTIRDAAGNDAVLTLNSIGSTNNVFVNTVVPTVILSTTATSPLNQPFTAKITFSEVVTGFVVTDITVSNATLGVFSTADNITYNVLVTPTAAGAVNLSIPANVAVNIGNNGNAVSNALTLTYDPVGPNITNVTVPANNTYKKGEVLSFNVYYNENIVADTTHGVPFINLILASGAHNVPVTAIGSNYATFSYTVQAGDEDLSGPALGTSMNLNSGTIRDAAGNDANFTLQNVGSLHNVLVDAKGPVVDSVSVPGDGYYHTGNTLSFTVHFSENIVVTGTPAIDVTIGSTIQKAYYISGTGSRDLVFSYQVQSGEMDLDGIAVGAMQFNSGTIRDAASNDAVLTLHNVGGTSRVFVNTVVPAVTLSTTATSPLNHAFTVKITFSEVVTGFAVTDITVSNATLGVFSTADNITYNVLVTPTAAGAVNLSIPANVAVNIGNNGNTASNALTLTYDPVGPNITNVTVPANKTYRKGEVLSFNVYYNENIVADTTHGVPFINLILASGPHNLPVTAIGSNYVTFSYTVQTGDEDLLGPALGTNMNLNSGTIRDAAGNDAHVTLQNVGSLRNVLVDAKGPVVDSVSVPDDGYYHTGNTLSFAVHFSENVVVAGTPAIDVTIGSTIQKASYVSGTGSRDLVFSYQVQNGEMDMDGIAVGAMQLNSGTIRDAAGNDAVLTLYNVGSTSHVFVNTVVPAVTLSTTVASPLNHAFTAKITFSEVVTGFAVTDITVSNATLGVLSTSDNITYNVLVTPTAAGVVNLSIPANVAVNIGNNGNTASNALTLTYDPIAPNITNVTVPANKTYKKGEVLSFNVYYNENIVADTTHGVPFINLILATGDHNVPATAIGSNYVTFSYTVQTGDEDLSGPALGTNMNLNSGTIRDAAGNDANVTLQNVGSLRHVLVDAKGPVVDSVGVPANDYYKAGQQLDFTVHVSENVLVASQPSIDIIIGNVTRHAVYNNGTGSKALVFRYTVQPGDQDTDGIAVAGPIVMNGGSIRDISTNDIVRVLNNVGNTSQVFVNTVIPSVVLSSAAVAPLNKPFSATITFSEAVTGFAAGSITGTNAIFSNLQTTDRITYTVLVTPTTDGAVTMQVPASVAVNVGRNGNTASNTLSFIYDGTSPFISSVTLPADGYYKTGTNLGFALQLSENVAVSMAMGAKSYLTLTIGSGIEHAYYTGITGGNVLHYSYTVKAGDMDMDGITVAPGLSLNGTLIRDAAGNDLLLPLHNMGSTAGIFVNTAHPSVVLSTTVTGRINTAFPVTLRFSEAISGLTAASIQVNNGTVGNLQKKDAVTYTVDITPAADGAVSVILPAGVVVNIGGNDNTASNIITVNYDGAPPVIPAGLVFTVNQNSPVGTAVGKLTATEATGIIQDWTITGDNSGGAFALDANGNITVKNVAALNSHVGTTVTLQVTVSDGLNTTAPVAVAIKIVLVNKAPTLNVIVNVNACATTEVYTIKLTGASATEPQQTYTYNVSSSADLFDELTVTNNDVFRYKLKKGVSSGQATIAITIKDNGGTDNGGVDSLRRTFTITVHSLPVVNISSDKGTTISKGDIVALTATGSNTYRWADADGIISGERTPVLRARPMLKTIYTVIATNNDGCSSTGEITIDINEDFKVDATNLLTPNGDGKNDRWVIRNIDSYPDNEVKIFDRAGRMVYQRRNYSNDWQGTLNGNPLAEGTYYYILSIQNGAKTTKGFITIIRDK